MLVPIATVDFVKDINRFNVNRCGSGFFDRRASLTW